jgi:hypothetical protein
MSNDKFQGTIVGTVERVRQYAKGDVVTLAVKTNPNAQYPDRVTVWCVGSSPVGEGARASVTGSLSVKVEEYNGKHRAQVSVNFPTWGDVEPAAPLGESVGSHEAGSEPWASDSTPF